jgi:RNA polymerase sigma-70 factor (ECF subfamily)
VNAPAGADPDRSDHELVAAARAGDRRALDRLLRRHHDRVVTICRQLCRDRADAEDAAQEALIAIVRGLDRFDGRAAFTTWTYRVATNACLDELRRRRRRPVPLDIDRAPEPAAPDAGPAEQALRAEHRSELAAAMDRLPEEFRTPLVLRDVADLDYATIAEILDLPPGTVRSRIARGRARLAGALAQDDVGGNREELVDVGTSSGTAPAPVPDPPRSDPTAPVAGAPDPGTTP